MSVVAVYITENRLQELQNIWLAWPERHADSLSSVNLIKIKGKPTLR